MTDPQNRDQGTVENQSPADPRLVEIEGRRKRAVSTLMVIVTVNMIVLVAIALLTFAVGVIPQNLGLWLMVAFAGATALLNLVQQRRVKKIDDEATALRAQTEGGSTQL